MFNTGCKDTQTQGSVDRSSSDEDVSNGVNQLVEGNSNNDSSDKLAHKRTLLKNNCRLSSLEEEMLQWALEGFPPLGEEGFKVSSEYTSLNGKLYLSYGMHCTVDVQVCM